MSNRGDAYIKAVVRCWVQSVVVDLNLCPFAAPTLRDARLGIAVSHATHVNQLVQEIGLELAHLSNTSEEVLATSLLVMPELLADFDEYNQFLDIAEQIISDQNLDGVIQIASFHPNYQFAGAQPDALQNYSNRSPYPLLHFLRESMVTKAVDGAIDTLAVSEQNKATLAKVGHRELKRRLDRCFEVE